MLSRARCQQPRPLCAICDKTNDTMRLCKRHRFEQRKLGIPWFEGDDHEQVTDERGLIAAERAAMEHGDPAWQQWADLRDRTAAPVPKRTMQILLLVQNHTIRVPYRPRGRARSKQEWAWRSRALHLAEVAALVGVKRQVADRILRRKLTPLIHRMVAARNAQRTHG